MAGNWNSKRAGDRIDQALKDVEKVEVKTLVSKSDVLNLPTNVAYKVDAAHIYIDLLNIYDMLGKDSETEQKHRRALWFLNLHQRAVQVILEDADAVKVDFHNQRLHAVVVLPLDDEAKRINKAVTIGDSVIKLLKSVSDPDDPLPAAKVRVGIDSGMALAVNNGRRGSREPLFLGNPANIAAKLAAGTGTARTGIFVTSGARKTAGLDVVEVEDQATTPLSKTEIEAAVAASGLDIDIDDVLETWNDQLADHPLKSFKFTRPTPPLSDFEAIFSEIGPASSRRIEGVTFYADIDGFTKFVATHLDDEPEKVVRTLHVLRKELHSVLNIDFDGMKVRFIGDCIHGQLAEGAASTDREATVSTAVLAAGGMRSSFDLAKEKIGEIDELGLAIGFDLGYAAMSRLGIKGKRSRCSLGRATIQAEDEQKRCSGTETALGSDAYSAGSKAVQDLFGKKRKKADLDYAAAVTALSDQGDSTAKAAVARAMVTAPAYVKAASDYDARPYSTPMRG